MISTHIRIYALALVVFAVLSGSELSACAGVEIWTESLSIPTYTVADPDPNPRFYIGRGYQGAQGRVYPYAMADVLTNKKESRQYEAVYLENEFLKICVLPEIGGRIFSARDKTNGYDVFYRQHVIKPALIGMLGAWTSGGVEWNFPHHHRARSFMPMDYRIVKNGDGSKTLWMGEMEYRHRMRFLLGLTLYPEKSYLETTVKILNVTPFVHSFLYWANPSVHVDETYQVIFPPQTQFVTQHAKSEFSEWPISNSRYGRWQYNHVDISWWKNLKKPVSFFCWNEDADFFAGYNHGKDAGTVYVADHQLAPGKKFFTFGCGDEGRMWDKMLTDHDGPYLELMAGAFSDNQPDYSWIQPYEVKTVTQYWYPIRDTGGLVYANCNAAVNVLLEQGTADIRVNSTSVVTNARIILKAGSRVLYRTATVLRPDRPYQAKIALPKGADRQDLRVIIKNGEDVIAQYQAPVLQESPPKPKTVVPPPAPKDIKTIEELYLAGLRLDQFYNTKLDPGAYYTEALRRDPNDSRVNTQLGIEYCKKGLYELAERHLKIALGRLTHNYTRPKTAEAFYYLGRALRGQHKNKTAYEAFGKASWDLAFQSASNYALAELDCLEHNYDKAIEHLKRACAANTENPKILNLKTVVLRKLGHLEAARRNVARTREFDPLNGWAANEYGLLGESPGNTRVSRDVQSSIEVAVNYGNAGFYAEAIDVLSRCKAEQPHPMIYYYLGFYSGLNGDSRQSRDWFVSAAKLPPEYCFPFRIESIDVLGAAIAEIPDNGRAYCYLGNLWYDMEPDKAIRYWRKAVDLDAASAVGWRNLAFAYRWFRKDIPQAVCCMEKAVSINPDDPRYYYELDALYEAAKVPVQKRIDVLEKNASVVSRRDDVLARKAHLYLQTDQYRKAFDLLTTHHFNTWEGGGQIHDTYVDACLLYGRRRLLNNDREGAIKLYQAALEYPDNLEVGRPVNDPSAVKPLYLLGQLYEMCGDRQSAAECYREAVAITTTPDECLYYQGLALLQMNCGAEAAVSFSHLISEGRRLLRETGRQEFFAKFGERRPENKVHAHARFLIGLGLLGQDQPDAAEAEFKSALELDCDHLWARIQVKDIAQSRAEQLATNQTESAKAERELAQTSAGRPIPVPLPNHPGNIFLDNETVVISIADELAEHVEKWSLINDAAEILASGIVDRSVRVINIGRPGIGWYKIEYLDGEGSVVDFTTAAVLASPIRPIPIDSPVCVDAAISWFADGPSQQEALASIAALARVNWIRDRITWRDVQPTQETWKEGDYRASFELQQKHGLPVLQTFHDTPAWAAADSQNSRRFPEDLRVVYNSCRQFAQAFKGTVDAWEPWNEANAGNFGGHTMAEMCTYQKAAFLGFKQGDPEILVGWNPCGGVSTDHHTEGVLLNEAWSYFDTYNIHSYDWPASYEEIFGPARRAACGKPIWLTESDRGLPADSGYPWHDFSVDKDLLKARFMLQSYASSLHAGVSRQFHFVLSHYVEGRDQKIQFGLLRKDFTPRPSYVALAAVGRFLAGAKALGRYPVTDRPDAYLYVFRARPDGRECDVLVAWNEVEGDWHVRGNASMAWPLPGIRPQEVYDYLGRAQPTELPSKLTSSPVIMCLPKGAAADWPLQKPQSASLRSQAACPIVLQLCETDSIVLNQDKDRPWIIEPRYEFPSGDQVELNFIAYNFGDEPVDAIVTAEQAPPGWTLCPNQWNVPLKPMERKRFSAVITLPEAACNSVEAGWIKLGGSLTSGRRTSLAFYAVTDDQGKDAEN